MEGVAPEADHVHHRSELVVVVLNYSVLLAHPDQLAYHACVGRQHVQEQRLVPEMKPG